MDQRRDRLLQPEHDPYRRDRKLHDPTVCPDCSATIRDGRWSHAHGPVDAPRVRCPACERTADDLAAGILRLRGDFARQNDSEIERLLRNVESRERAEHPLKRIMDVDRAASEVTIRTTDAHLAKDLGAAVKRAYGGELEIDYAEDIVRVDWSR